MFVNGWNNTISKKRIAKYDKTIYLPETGYELDMDKFMSWVLDHIMHDDTKNHSKATNTSGEYQAYNSELIRLSQKLNGNQGKEKFVSKTNTKLTATTLSLVETYLMEDEYYNNYKYEKKEFHQDDEIGEDKRKMQNIH